jgi:hypothetical protein
MYRSKILRALPGDVPSMSLRENLRRYPLSEQLDWPRGSASHAKKLGFTGLVFDAIMHFHGGVLGNSSHRPISSDRTA